MDIPLALTSLAKSLEVLKAMRDIDKNYDSASYKSQIAELMSSLADAKMTLIEAREKVSDLEKDLVNSNAKLKYKADKTVKSGHFVYEVFDDGKIAYYPFCPTCLNRGEFLPIIKGAGIGDAACPHCKVKLYSRAISYKATPSVQAATGSEATSSETHE